MNAPSIVGATRDREESNRQDFYSHGADVYVLGRGRNRS